MVKKNKDIIQIAKDNTMIIFTTSPAGLGHIRVMEALKGALPQNMRSETLGINDPKVQMMHRLTSRNIFLRKIMEFLQTNFYTEAVITKIYVSYLRKYTKEIYFRLLKLIKRRSPNPRLVIVVATHVSLAHQIAQIKSKLSLNLKVKIILCVVVTDDTPLIIWAVKGADLIFVPSLKTRNYLSSYAQRFDIDEKPKFVVNAYPISTKFSVSLSATDIRSRIDQLSIKEKPINIIIPVSGAAVSLDYFREVISYLTNKKRALFTVVSRESSYTRQFLDFCESNPQVTLMADFLDRDVVLSYENAILSKVFALEITKPSEQAFKVLLNPRQAGGVIMLFSQPVGRQEYDNLSFMRRFSLVPSKEEQDMLDDMLRNQKYDSALSTFGEKSRNWRGVVLPEDGNLAARMILRYKYSGLFKNMCFYSKKISSEELSDKGVTNFWMFVNQEITK